MTRINWTRASLNAGSFLAAVILCYGLFVLASEKWPEPPRTCSCDGRDDCRTDTFQIYDGDTAVCAFYDDGTSCCRVPHE